MSERMIGVPEGVMKGNAGAYKGIAAVGLLYGASVAREAARELGRGKCRM